MTISRRQEALARAAERLRGRPEASAGDREAVLNAIEEAHIQRANDLVPVARTGSEQDQLGRYGRKPRSETTVTSQAVADMGSDVNPEHRHHAIDYVELRVTDMTAAKQFYAEAFGWVFTDYGPAYAGIQSIAGSSEPEVGGLVVTESVRTGGPLVLLFSTDLDRTASAVADAGGVIVDGPTEFPDGRRFLFRDPSGNELGVWAES